MTVYNSNLTVEQMAAKLKAIEAENAALKVAAAAKIRFKVSEKKAVSVYGLNARWPVTLYKGQWERLIASVPAIQKFIADHEHELAVKE